MIHRSGSMIAGWGSDRYFGRHRGGRRSRSHAYQVGIVPSLFLVLSSSSFFVFFRPFSSFFVLADVFHARNTIAWAAWRTDARLREGKTRETLLLVSWLRQELRISMRTRKREQRRGGCVHGGRRRDDTWKKQYAGSYPRSSPSSWVSRSIPLNGATRTVYEVESLLAVAMLVNIG